MCIYQEFYRELNKLIFSGKINKIRIKNILRNK